MLIRITDSINVRVHIYACLVTPENKVTQEPEFVPEVTYTATFFKTEHMQDTISVPIEQFKFMLKQSND